MSTEVFSENEASLGQCSSRESNKRLREDSDLSSVESSEFANLAEEVKQLKLQMKDVINSVNKMSSSVKQVLTKLNAQESKFKEINK